MRMLEMFEKADLDNNGQLTWDEYSLAKAWWLQTNIDPSRIDLF